MQRRKRDKQTRDSYASRIFHNASRILHHASRILHHEVELSNAMSVLCKAQVLIKRSPLTPVSHWKLGLKWKLGSHYCITESFFTAYLLCIGFSSLRCKLQFSSSFAADKDGWNGETYHSALYSLVIIYHTNYFPAIYNENSMPSVYVHECAHAVNMRSWCGLTNQ